MCMCSFTLRLKREIFSGTVPGLNGSCTHSKRESFPENSFPLPDRVNEHYEVPQTSGINLFGFMNIVRCVGSRYHSECVRSEQVLVEFRYLHLGTFCTFGGMCSVL